MDSPSERAIELRISNNKAYVWDVEDLALLRAKHHICGVLTGTLPHVSQQNVFLGMPLVLMPEEVVLLVENGLAVLVDDPTAHRKPSRSELEKWNTERRALVKTQLVKEGAKEGGGVSAPTGSRSMSEEAIRKRKAREEKRAAAKSPAEGGEDTPVFVPSTPAQAQATVPVAENSNLAHATYTITVPANSASELGWYSPEDYKYSTVKAAMQAGIWSYPSSAHERAKCKVFQDLWKKGHYMGGGIKFGGDYLVYPGDPLRYHSHFVASVIDSPAATISPMEIVAHGRLGTATKKAHLLCNWDEEKQTVSYYSVEWAGFG
ncbi:tRNA-intron endonuclease catalytic domain-like protein [Cristinia sonorae]|uniref:tRNA-splicing endonuclease subunit Sen34 n=1 Tax=Cristinia sonorae TaxID=1940300 RepID=A0A8K0UYX2_9AGAR|nr:tRNA-intron endonuclease catalytic domain-like protein [Cristinia sonorae]